MRSIWHSCRLMLALVTTSLFLAACGGGGGGEAAPPPPVQPPAATGTVSGTVVSSQSGAALSGATVRVGTASTTSGTDGRYTLAGVATGAALVEFSAANHARSFANATVTANQTARADARLTPVGARATVSAASGGAVSVPNSPAQVVLPAAGLVDRNGAAFSGPVTVELTPIDPAADPGNMPGELSTRSGSTVQPIESFGALSVNLQDAGGNRLNLASGRTATIRIPLATRSPNPPATVPLFFFDETAGTWKQEGTATLAGTAPNQYYEGTVAHFTFWNADQVTETVFVRGCVQTGGGVRAGQVEVESEGLDYTGSARAITDANGEFSVGIRRNGRATIIATDANGRTTNVATVGPSAADITLPSCLVLGNGAPVFVQQPQSITAAENSFVVLRALAKGDEPLRYQWQRNGVNVANATGSFLVISPLPAGDNGATYRAVATNAVGTATSEAATITVQLLPPAFARQPQSQTIIVGQDATFSVELAAQGQPVSLQWLRNGVAIPGAMQTSYTLASVALVDDGARFSVRASNPAGQVVSAEATLSVSAAAVPPAITQQPADVSVTVGQAALFSVVAGGTQPLSYQWRRNGADIAGATGTSYTLPVAALADNGARFSVRVSNPAGNAVSNEATLSVTQGGGGLGYYLVSEAGAVVRNNAIVFANGAQTYDSAALVALNTANPAGGLITLENAGAAARILDPVVQGSASASRLSDLRPRFALYFKGGRLFRVDQAAGATPVPQPTSTLRSEDVCGTGGAPDTGDVFGSANNVPDPTLAWIVMRGPGADGQCNTADDRFRAVRMNMAATDAALSIGEPLVQLVNPDGANAGVLVKEGNQVRRLDANLANPADLFTLSGGAFVNDGPSYGATTPAVWVFQDGDTLYGYDLAAGGARVPLATLSAAELQSTTAWQLVADGDTAFVALPGANSTRLLRLARPLAASAVGTVPFGVQQLALTPSRIVMLAQDALYSLPRGGGTPQLLASGQATSFLSTAFTGGENVVYQRSSLVNNAVVFSVGLVRADGSNAQELPNTLVAGLVWPPSVGLAALDAQVYAVIVAEGINAQGGASGATLRAIELATRGALVTYGTLPAQPAQTFVFQDILAPFHWGQPGLFTWSASGVGSDPSAVDLFYFDSDQPGLQRLTRAVAGGGAAAPNAAVRERALRGLKGLRGGLR